MSAKRYRAALSWLALALAGAVICNGAASAKPRAVILLVGDGLGFSQLSLTRYAALGKGGRLSFESFPVTGLVSTWSASNFVTDSGAAATAFASGSKSDNRFLGLDSRKVPVRTVADAGSDAGWRVGLVTTTRITHATPACFYAHHDDRYDEETVAAQLLDSRVDLAFGGGLSFFLPREATGDRRDGRNLVEEARARGVRILTRGQAPEWDGKGRVIGLFASSHLTYDLDDRNYPPERRDPTLAAMTRAALAGLSAGDRPFFLMIEGGRIDHAGHDFDAAGIVAETLRFDEAARVVEKWAEDHPETLVLVTADHATGGLALNDFADWKSLARQSASIAWMAAEIRYAGGGKEMLAERSGFADWTDDEVEAVRRAKDSYEAARSLGRSVALRDGFTWAAKVTDDDTHGHTGEDVPIYALGPGAERFGGAIDNTEIALRLATLLGWQLGPLEQSGASGAEEER